MFCIVFCICSVIYNKMILRNRKKRPGWCGSVDWAPDCKPKGREFNSQSEHMPGLQAGSPVGGAQVATTQWCFSSSLSPSLPLSKNKIKLVKSKNTRIFQKLKKNRKHHTLVGVAQWIQHWPANQRVTGSIPSQGTCLGCWPALQ